VYVCTCSDVIPIVVYKQSDARLFELSVPTPKIQLLHGRWRITVEILRSWLRLMIYFKNRRTTEGSRRQLTSRSNSFVPVTSTVGLYTHTRANSSSVVQRQCYTHNTKNIRNQRRNEKMKTVFATIALFAVANAYTAPFMATRAVKKAAPAAPKVSNVIW